MTRKRGEVGGRVVVVGQGELVSDTQTVKACIKTQFVIVASFLAVTLLQIDM